MDSDKTEVVIVSAARTPIGKIADLFAHCEGRTRLLTALATCQNVTLFISSVLDH